MVAFANREINLQFRKDPKYYYIQPSIKFSREKLMPAPLNWEEKVLFVLLVIASRSTNSAHF